MLCYVCCIPYLDSAASSCIMIDALWRKKNVVRQPVCVFGRRRSEAYVPRDLPVPTPASMMLRRRWDVRDTGALSHVATFVYVDVPTSVVGESVMSVVFLASVKLPPMFICALCAKLIKRARVGRPVCPSICIRVSSPKLLNRFPWNLIFNDYNYFCPANLILVSV
jgi:hypothetical protein